MRIKNHTDIPIELIREIIRHTCPSGVSGFDVRISNLGADSGRWPGRGSAYVEGSSYHDRRCRFIVVSLGKRDYFPMPSMMGIGRNGYLPLPWFASREEAAVYYIAHELRHLWQGKIKRGYRVWGARGQYSERDACAYAIRTLRGWRAKH